MKVVAYEARYILLQTQSWACSSITCCLCANQKDNRQLLVCSHTEKQGRQQRGKRSREEMQIEEARNNLSHPVYS